MLKAAVLPVTAFQQNCTLLWCDETMAGAVVDPGGDVERILEAVAKYEVKLEKILITHGHMDHAGGTAELSERLSLPIDGPHIADKFLIDELGGSGARFGMAARSFEPDRWLNDGDTVSFGNINLEVRHCPGHTPGHIIFYEANTKVAQVGDVLFQGSVGRTDLPRGDHAQLINSIKTRLWPLGNDVTFIPGHGPISTFGEERQSNPFVADRVLAAND